MAIQFKTVTRETKRIGLSGKAGCGKSTAITKISRRPLVYDLERKWTKDLLPVQPVEIGAISFDSLKASLIGVLKEPSLKPHDILWIDSASELYRMCENHAIQNDYKGIKNNYSAYSTGPKHELIQYFTQILKILSDIEVKHRIDIGIICHDVLSWYPYFKYLLSES